MVNLDLAVARSLDNYFTILSSVGHLNQQDTQKLVLLVGLRDMVRHFKDYFTEQDWRKIISVLDCLKGSCVVDIPTKCSDNSVFTNIETV